MAGLAVVMLAFPGVYVAANVASVVEGRGLRLAGGFLDLALITGSVAANVAVQARILDTLEKKQLPVDTTAMIPLAAAGTGMLYATIKTYIGSPTTYFTNFIVGASGVGVPAVMMGSLFPTSFH